MNRRARLVFPFFALFAILLAAGSGRSGEDGKRDLALCVGIGSSGRYSAKHSARDALAIAAALEDHGSFRRVIAMTDDDQALVKSLPGRKNLLAIAKLVANAAGAGDGFFVYVSAPASLAGDELRLVPAGDPDGEHIPLKEVLDILHASGGGGGMVVLDIRVPEWTDAPDRVASSFPEYPGMAVVFYCSDGQAVAADAERRGLLSLGLENAILAADDPDGDGALSAGELYDRIHRHVTDHYLENLVLDGHAPEINAGGRAALALRIAAPSGEADAEAEAETAVVDAAEAEAEVETVAVAEPEPAAAVVTVTSAAAEPQYYTDPSTGRVFRYDEAKRDWVIHSDTTYARSSQPAYNYQQPQQQYYQQQQQQQYRQQPQQQRGGVSPGAVMNAASVFGSIASFLIGP